MVNWNHQLEVFDHKALRDASSVLFGMAMHCVGGVWLIVGAITGTFHW
jgi:hypothetical protein